MNESTPPLNDTEKPSSGVDDSIANDNKNNDDEILTDPLKELEKRCETAENESRQIYERLLRVSADFENYKKRTLKETEDFRKYANEVLLTELLSVVDNLERAIKSSGNKESAVCIIEGIEMTLKDIHKIFEKFSVKLIDATGKDFDPNFHQAVMQEQSDEHPANVVICEFQKGYMLHDRLLRPSMVVVSKGPKKTE